MRNLFLFVLLLNFTRLSQAEEADSGAGFRAGKTLAVQEANLKDGFRLADKAREVIGVKTTKIGAIPFAIDQKSLVYFGDKVGVYRFRKGWFKLVEVKVTKGPTSQFLVQSDDLTESDEIASEGVALLRVSEMDAFGGEE